MNLFDLARRKDPNLALSGDVSLTRRTCQCEGWRGLLMPSGTSFTIKDIRRFVTFRHFPEQIGWLIDVPANGEATLRLTSNCTGEDVGVVKLNAGVHPVSLPWPQFPCGSVDLQLRYDCTGGQPLFVGNHRIISREWLWGHCIGRGVEIGPGPVPQILPKPGRDVSYLEQMPAEEWNRLYNGGGKYPVRPDLWSSYIVGVASDLPVADGSLDFIFGSHVFEHLANPIGHLKRWHAKLKSGAKVAMVVPDLHGTKDAIHHRCSLESMVDEFNREIWLPEPHHYSRHLRRSLEDRRLISLMQRNESIHVHYYDNVNAQQLLDFAVRNLGYDDYIIKHTPNHKDFHFLLVR
jgi:predicted SAM-dependent methyltransferase